MNGLTNRYACSVRTRASGLSKRFPCLSRPSWLRFHLSKSHSLSSALALSLRTCLFHPSTSSRRQRVRPPCATGRSSESRAWSESVLRLVQTSSSWHSACQTCRLLQVGAQTGPCGADQSKPRAFLQVLEASTPSICSLWWGLHSILLEGSYCVQIHWLTPTARIEVVWPVLWAFLFLRRVSVLPLEFSATGSRVSDSHSPWRCSSRPTTASVGCSSPLRGTVWACRAPSLPSLQFASGPVQFLKVRLGAS